MPPKVLPGFRDFYPEQLAERAHIFNVWREVVAKYAFVEYDGPPLEPLDLYTAKSGDEIVTQLYNFVDKGDRAVALRPEMTPTFARMVAARAQSLRKPVRWFSLPQLFRYERQQKGRLREHYQLNVDIVGEASELADAELLAVAIDIMRTFGLTHNDVRARVSDRRLLNALLEHIGVTEQQLPVVYAVLDKFEREPRDVADDKMRDAGLDVDQRVAIISLCAATFEEILLEYQSRPKIKSHLARFEQYRGYARALGIIEWIKFDLTIVRGLAYYTGIVFELFDAIGEFRAICGGGRYDNLLRSLGGVDLPALGFGMGDVVLGELLRARGLMNGVAPKAAQLWIVAAEGVASDTVLHVAQALRDGGFSVEYILNAERLVSRRSSAQLQDAAKANAEFAVLCTSDSEGDLLNLRVRTSDGSPAAKISLNQLHGDSAPAREHEFEKIRSALAAPNAVSHTA